MAEFTAVFEKDGDWYIGWVEEFGGAFGQGRTLDEARESLREAVILVLEAKRERSAEELVGRDVIRERIAVPVP